jgi:NAD(P)-dependent dehydrogenase (short-subunit alcohol dehydrogenase family)
VPGPAPGQLLIVAATSACGPLDILICNHAHSGGDGPLGTLDAAMLDAQWAVNTRSSILLAQSFAAQHNGRPGGRITPDDPARLIAWLATDEAAWITGQVIHTEGGFRRSG